MTLSNNNKRNLNLRFLSGINSYRRPLSKGSFHYIFILNGENIYMSNGLKPSIKNFLESVTPYKTLVS